MKFLSVALVARRTWPMWGNPEFDTPVILHAAMLHNQTLVETFNDRRNEHCAVDRMRIWLRCRVTRLECIQHIVSVWGQCTWGILCYSLCWNCVDHSISSLAEGQRPGGILHGDFPLHTPSMLFLIVEIAMLETKCRVGWVHTLTNYTTVPLLVWVTWSYAFCYVYIKKIPQRLLHS